MPWVHLIPQISRAPRNRSGTAVTTFEPLHWLPRKIVSYLSTLILVSSHPSQSSTDSKLTNLQGVHTKKLHGEKTAPLPDGQHSWQRCKKGQFSRCAVNTPVGSLVDRDALHQFPRKPFGCFELKQKGYCCKSKDTPLNECKSTPICRFTLYPLKHTL